MRTLGILTALMLAVTFVGLTRARAHENPNPPMAAERPAVMKIVPADVVEPNSAFFLGTGDGAAGSWTRF